MSDWKKYDLMDTFWFQEGPGIRNWQFTDSGTKVLNVANILQDGSLDLVKSSRYISDYEATGKYQHFLVDEGDLVIASSGISFDSDGFLRTKIAFVEAGHLPLCMNTSTIRFKAKDKISDLKFLRHWLGSIEFRKQISQFVTGSAQLNFGPSHLKKMTITLPPLEEQKRIAAILDQADALRRQRQRALNRLNQLGQSIFYEMFGSTEENIVPLSEYFEEIRMGPFGSLLHKSDYVEGGIPLINPMHIKDDKILADPSFTISARKAEELTNYRLRNGDIVIGRRGEMGRCAVVQAEQEGYLCGTGSMFLRASRSKVDPFFLADLIRSKNVIKRIEAVASGVTMMNLNSKSFERVMVPNVPIKKQNEYFEKVKIVEEAKPKLLRSYAELNTLFFSLQHRAFRGELGTGLKSGIKGAAA